MSITTRLLLALGLMAAFVGVVAGVGLLQLRGFDDKTAAFVQQSMPRIDTMQSLTDRINRVGSHAYRAYLADDPQVMAEQLEAVNALKGEIGDMLGRMDQMFAAGDEQAKALQMAIQNDNSSLLVALTKFGRFLQAGKRDIARVALYDEALPRIDAMRGTVQDYSRYELSQLTAMQQSTHEAYRSSVRLMAGIGVFVLLLAVVLAVTITRSVSHPLAGAIEVLRGVADGDLQRDIPRARTREIVQLLDTMRKMRDDLRSRQERERLVAQENLAVRNALDQASACVSILDGERCLRYSNPALAAMFEAGAGELRPLLPQLDSAALAGLCIDGLLSQEQIEQLRSPLREPLKLQLQAGSRSYALVISAIHDERGERLGSVIEWKDRTGEIAVEQEIAGIVEAAAEGDFSRRVLLQGKQGFFAHLAAGINGLLGTSARALDDVSALLGALAGGDLTRKITADYSGMLARIQSDANDTVQQLAETVGRIKTSTEALGSAAREIAAGNADLSRRTEQQAVSLEQTTASMEQLTKAVRQNAEHARHANQLAIGASDVAARGGTVVDEVIRTMSAIHASSKRIEDIIGVIDGIAFQTNILALNAAVEAARAGEQGRGFAVVAAEVRSLAQRSAAAAREIKALIGESVTQVGSGSTLVQQAGQTMQEIVGSVRRVTGLMADIAAASQGQSSGIDQVNQALAHMDETTQQNAALVEEASAAAASLDQQAASLVSAVQRFRLAEPALAPVLRLARG